jgi:hypothetical protein
MDQVIIGVDPHKLSATIEVVDHREQLLGAGRFTTDQAGYAAMRTYTNTWPQRVWAVEGANGAGRPLAQRLLEAGEQVLDVPAKLAARVRLFDTGHNRKTDAPLSSAGRHDGPIRPSSWVTRFSTLMTLRVSPVPHAASPGGEVAVNVLGHPGVISRRG